MLIMFTECWQHCNSLSLVSSLARVAHFNLYQNKQTKPLLSFAQDLSHLKMCERGSFWNVGGGQLSSVTFFRAQSCRDSVRSWWIKRTGSNKAFRYLK